MQDLKDRQIAELRVQRNNAYDESAQFGARFTEAHEALQEAMKTNAELRAELEAKTKVLTDADAAADLAGVPRPEVIDIDAL